MPIVAGLLSEHPELSIRVVLVDRVMRLAEEGLDVAVRIAHLPDSALRAMRLATVQRVWVASPDYLARRGASQRVRKGRQEALSAAACGYERPHQRLS
jgi:DNA-binding transcriptional LysR family regulator